MRKHLALLLAVILVIACGASLAESAGDENICTYTVYNETEETVVELYLIDNATGEKGENYAGEAGLKPYESVEIKGTNYEGYVKSLYFKTESGYEATFATLHFETVPISLLPAPKSEEDPDAVTAATPINFFLPSHPADYLVHNQTGENVVSVTFTNNATGDVMEAWTEQDEINVLKDGESVPCRLYFSADTTKDLELTLRFVTESGYEGVFPTLHFENVQINLLPPVDATTGATAISFGMLPTE